MNLKNQVIFIFGEERWWKALSTPRPALSTKQPEISVGLQITTIGDLMNLNLNQVVILSGRLTMQVNPYWQHIFYQTT